MALFRILLSPNTGEGASLPPGDAGTATRSEHDPLRTKADPDLARGPIARQDHGKATEASEPAGTLSRYDFEKILKDRESKHMKELAARDQRVAELELACRDALRDRELATALAGKPLVPGAAAQLIKLWRDDFDVYDEGGVYQVTAREGRTVSQAVADRLASAEYAHFCLPSSRGGAGARDANRPVASVANQAPKNLGEAVLMHWRKEAATRPGEPSKPIGLGRRR